MADTNETPETVDFNKAQAPVSVTHMAEQTVPIDYVEGATVGSYLERAGITLQDNESVLLDGLRTQLDVVPEPGAILVVTQNVKLG